jgi:uncharacterized protein
MSELGVKNNGRWSLQQCRPVELLVIQPTPFCNLNCTYCYLPDRSSKRRMTTATLEQIAKAVVAGGWAARDVTVVWHAGEPLVLPPSWYEDAFALFESYRPAEVCMTHALQTNGTLLNERWLPIVSRPDVRLGVSVDGPPALHNVRRKTRGGRGTFEAAIRGVRLLRSWGVPFHVITVLSFESLSHPDELIDFYVSEGVERVCFNVEEIEGLNRSSSLAVMGVETAFCEFFRRIIRRLGELKRPLWIREIASSLAAIAAPAHEFLRNPQIEPFAILSIDSDGNLSTFSPELLGSTGTDFGGFRFGNVTDCDPGALLQNENFLRAWSDIAAGVDSCRARCAWFRWCGGGAPANKLFETGSFAVSETLYCRLTKQTLLDVVLEAIEQDQIMVLGRAA